MRGVIEPWHIFLLVIVLLLLFGSKKLPDMSRSLMRSMHIMKDEARKLRDDKHDDGDDDRSRGSSRGTHDDPQAQLTRATADTEARERARAHATTREPAPPVDPH